MDKRSNDYFLAKYDVSGIQSYIFATNRLQENAGASYQVTRILEEFLPQAIEAEQIELADDTVLSETTLGNGTPRTVITDWEKQNSLKLPYDECIQAEIIYIGGGNAVVLYRKKELYIRVGQNMCRKIAGECQGIYLAATCIGSSLLNFKDDIKQLNRKLSENKRNMIRQPIFTPFPVVERDNSTHQPITHRIHYKDSSRIDEDVTEIQFQKRKAYRQVKEWHFKEKRDKGQTLSEERESNRKNQGAYRIYPKIGENVQYDYPEEMSTLCRKPGEDSYIAIVHIDGNGMGEQVKRLLAEYEEYSQGVSALREKSKEISRLFSKAYEEVLQKLWEKSELLIPDESHHDNKILPLRPIILDGDDFTFICTADLAIPLAAGFLEELGALQKGQQEKVTACAGIAFAHSHFPFYQAYLVAEEACSKAKAKWYEEKKEKAVGSYLDFQVISANGIGGGKGEVKWQLRPYSVFSQDSVDEIGSLNKLYETLKEMEENWPSNRLHKIYHAMHEGKEQVKYLVEEFKSRGYQIESLTGNCIWTESPLFDALEIRGMCNTTLLGEFLNIQDEVK